MTHHRSYCLTPMFYVPAHPQHILFYILKHRDHLACCFCSSRWFKVGLGKSRLKYLNNRPGVALKQAQPRGRHSCWVWSTNQETELLFPPFHQLNIQWTAGLSQVPVKWHLRTHFKMSVNWFHSLEFILWYFIWKLLLLFRLSSGKGKRNVGINIATY